MRVDTRYTYRKIDYKEVAKKACCTCGKTFSRTFSDYGTINPFHDKTSGQIYSECEVKVKAEIAKWNLVDEECKSCRDAGINKIKDNPLSKQEAEELEKLSREYLQADMKARKIKQQMNDLIYKKTAKSRNGDVILLAEAYPDIYDIEHKTFPHISFWGDVVRKDRTGIRDKREQVSYCLTTGEFE